MIVKEFYKTRQDGVMLFRTYSDRNCLILQIETRILYEEAVDIEDASYTYEETDELIPKEETDNEKD